MSNQPMPRAALGAKARPAVAPTHCPSCGHKGRKLKTETPAALLIDAARDRWDGADLRFCREKSCEVVYFDASHEQLFYEADLQVPVFQKHDNADRLVCYCFNHSVAEIERDIAEHGSTEVPAAIAAACKAGLEACRTKNPQGACCLGNVSAVVNAALAKRGDDPGAASEAAAEISCCGGGCGVATDEPTASPPPAGGDKPRVNSLGRLSTVGAVIAALLASACCWLPLLLVGLGASTIGVAGFFEEHRMLFLGITAVFLAGGYYYVYFRKPTCKPGDACAVPNPKLQRTNKLSLWFATGLVILFATFPNYVGALVGGNDANATNTAAATQESDDVTRTYAVSGMTCKGCTGHIKTAVGELPGVKSVQVSYEEGKATVVFAKGQADDAKVAAAIAEYGYTIK